MNETKTTFVSEEESAGYATPMMDLIAAAALILLSVWIMAMSVGMPVPSDISTAPGLLPFLTAASVCVMAVVLGVLAWKRRAIDARSISEDLPPAIPQTVLLMVLLLIYVAAIEILSFEIGYKIAGIHYVFGSFELISIIFLTAIFRIFWTTALWACFSVSFVWILILSLIFRQIFKIPLPG